MACWWPLCNCRQTHVCGSICRSNSRSLAAGNFDVYTEFLDSGSGGSVETPVLTVTNDGTDLVLRMEWECEDRTWISMGGTEPTSYFFAQFLDNHVYSASDYGLPWVRRDSFKYKGDTDSSWICNDSQYANRKYSWTTSFGLPTWSENSSGRSVGSPCVYSVFEVNGLIYHLIGQLSSSPEDRIHLGSMNGFSGRPFIDHRSEQPQKQCLISRRGYNGSNSIGFFYNMTLDTPYTQGFPGLPFYGLNWGSGVVSLPSFDMMQDIIDHGYRMGFVVAWQLGTQPLTPYTGTSTKTWSNHTITADSRVRIQQWIPDVVASTGTVNCFEPAADFPNWLKVKIDIPTEVREAYEALTTGDCPSKANIYSLPTSEFICRIELLRRINISGVEDAPSVTDATKHSKTVSIVGDGMGFYNQSRRVCETGPLTPSQHALNDARNDAENSDGNPMGIHTIYFRQMCEENETSLACCVVTNFTTDVAGSEEVDTWYNGPVFFGDGLDTSDGAVNVLSLSDSRWLVHLEDISTGFDWALCLTAEQVAEITATISFHSSMPGLT